jgi:zinc transport system substrate-binding protein
MTIFSPRTSAALGRMAVQIMCFFSMPCVAHAAEPKVVVTVKPVHALVAGVMAGIGVPKLIVDGTTSPHTFTLKPSGAQAINQADVFIRVSEHLEPFTEKVVTSLSNRVKVLSLAQSPGVTLLDRRKGDTFEQHEHSGDEHGHQNGHGDDAHDPHEAGETKDSHIWLDPINAKAIVADVANILSETYPENADKFAANAAALNGKIDALAAEIEAELIDIKDKPFIVFHDATQYFERRFGVPAAGSVTVSPDVQPSAKRLTAVRKKIAALGAACVFAEPGFQPKLVAAVTGGTKANTGTLDPEGALLSPGPDLYFVLLRNLAANLKSCLAS